MKKRKFAILLTTLLLTGCGSPKLTEGEVYDKEFTKAYTATTIMPVTISNGKSCHTIMIPYIYHYDDSYSISIRDYDVEKQEWQTETYYTSKEVYEACEIGSIFVYDKERDSEEPTYTRERE